jgi:hypothetical protein
MSMKYLNETIGIRNCDILAWSQPNKTVIYLSPINPSPINHTFDIHQSELLAVSLYKTQITNPYVHSPSPTAVTLHKQSVPVDTYSLTCSVTHSKKCRCVIITVTVTVCRSKPAANQKAVAKQSAFSSSWQAAVGWLRTVQFWYSTLRLFEVQY